MKLEHMVATAALTLALTGCSGMYNAPITRLGEVTRTYNDDGTRYVYVKTGNCEGRIQNSELYDVVKKGTPVEVTLQEEYTTTDNGKTYTGCKVLAAGLR